MVNSFTIPYEITDNSKQNELNLRYALNKIGEYIKRKGKTLVIEDLDTSKSKMKNTYKDPKLNKILHSFPYEKYIQITKYTGIKYGFLVKLVSPKYTSIIGLLKYSYKMKLNSHIAASFVIAHRGLGIQEKVPFCYKHLIPKEIRYKHNWSKWNKLNSINKSNIKELKKNDVIVISNSVADHGRILAILDKADVIELNSNVKVQNATIEDIKSNPLNLQFKEIKPEILTSAYENNEGALVAINGNYAIDAGLNPTKDAVILESADESNPYVNIVACKKGHEKDEKIKALVDVLQSDKIKKFITDTYSDGSVIPIE